MSRQQTVIYAELSPAEVGVVADVPPDLQRVWRKRGFLPELKGSRASFDVFEAAALMVRQVLARRGEPPSRTAAIADQAAPYVILAALMDAEGSWEVIGPKAEVDAFVDESRMHHKILMGIAKTADVNKPYLLAFDNYRPELGIGFANEVEHSDAESVFIVNLHVLGLHFASRFGKPLVRVEVHSEKITKGTKSPTMIRRILPSKTAGPSA